jgi:hypothetical protein
MTESKEGSQEEPTAIVAECDPRPNGDSSDDEDDQYDPLEFQVTVVPANTAFHFYDNDYNESKIQDILEALHTSRNSYVAASRSARTHTRTGTQKRPNKHHGDENGDFLSTGTLILPTPDPNTTTTTKTFNIRDYQRTLHDPHSRTAPSVTIARFRTYNPKWDSAACPSKEVLNTLYRTAQSDPSGHKITNLGRDEARGVRPWQPPEADRELPVPTVVNCSDRRKQNLLAHMNRVIERVDAELKSMKAETNEKSQLKARVGADLNNLKMERDKLVRDFERAALQHPHRNQQHNQHSQQHDQQRQHNQTQNVS